MDYDELGESVLCDCCDLWVRHGLINVLKVEV